MMIPRSYRTVAVVLVATVLLFNAGVPITKYLCPMMSSENPTCEMSVPSFGDIPSITKQIPSCCAKYIVAERNSTPYLKLEHKFEAPLSFIALPADASPDPRDGWNAPLAPNDTGPPLARNPLYILNSTLLI